MSMHPQPIPTIPEETNRIAHAVLPKGNVWMQMRDELGTLYEDQDFQDLFTSRGQPAETSWRLALVSPGPSFTRWRRLSIQIHSRSGTSARRFPISRIAIADRSSRM